MVTIKDIAKAANVSVGTASRALQEVGYVSKQSKEKVLTAAKELGYVVNLGAKKLKSTVSKQTIGIIISEFGNDYFYKVMSILHKMLQELQMDLIITFSASNPVDEVKKFKYLISNRVTTILFIPTTDTNRDVLELATKNGINVIQLFVRVYKDYAAIVNDDELGCYLATGHLLKLNCKRIALLDVDYSNFSVLVEPSRNAGMIHALEKRPDVSYLTIPHDPNLPLSPDVIAKIEEFNPDGIIAGTGPTGLKVLEYLKRSSRKVKLVSFDDNEWLEYHGVTTIRQSMKELVNTICTLLTDTSNPDTPCYKKVLESLVVRTK